jgi:threonine dehydratase
VGVELVKRLKRADVVLVPLGGGGLLSGIAGYLKKVNSETQLIGCSPENSQVMIQSIEAGRIVDLPSKPTLSSATAGGVEPGAITFDLCEEFVDSFTTVSEDGIRDDMLDFYREEGLLIEGAAALPVAAFRRMSGRFAGKNVVLIISGGNVEPERLNDIRDIKA